MSAAADTNWRKTLEEATERFAAQLPFQCDALQEQLALIGDSSDGADQAVPLRRLTAIVHRIHGAAAVFGLHHVADAARALERSARSASLAGTCDVTALRSMALEILAAMQLDLT